MDRNKLKSKYVEHYETNFRSSSTFRNRPADRRKIYYNNLIDLTNHYTGVLGPRYRSLLSALVQREHPHPLLWHLQGIYDVEGINVLTKHVEYICSDKDPSAVHAVALLMCGHRWRDEGNYPKMMEYYKRSIQAAKKSGSQRWAISALYYIANYAKTPEECESRICDLIDYFLNYASIYRHKMIRRDLKSKPPGPTEYHPREKGGGKVQRPLHWLQCFAKSRRGQKLLNELPELLVTKLLANENLPKCKKFLNKLYEKQRVMVST